MVYNNMLGFHSMSEFPISTISTVILILNGDIYVTSVSINKVADFNSYVNVNMDSDVSINKTTDFDTYVNLTANNDLYVNNLIEIIVSR